MPLEDFLTSTADLLAQQAGVSDGFGAADREPYSAVATGLPCLVSPRSSTNARRNDRAELLATHYAVFAADAGFLASRRLVVDGTRVFEITGVIDGNSLGRCVRVECREVVE